MSQMKLWKLNGTYSSEGEPYGNEVQITTGETEIEAEENLKKYWVELGYDNYEMLEFYPLDEINGYKIILTNTE